MITQTQMYWLVTLDGISKLSFTLALVGVAWLFVGLAYVSEFRKHRWMIPVSIAVALLGMLAATFVPTTKQMAAIVVVPRIANNEKIRDAGSRLYDLAVEWMEELRPNPERKGRDEDRP